MICNVCVGVGTCTRTCMHASVCVCVCMCVHLCRCLCFIVVTFGLFAVYVSMQITSKRVPMFQSMIPLTNIADIFVKFQQAELGLHLLAAIQLNTVAAAQVTF